MEHHLEGPCCVCGVTTTHRCSPCAENGFDLFLCGREHQKLVWYAHKKVCGVKSKPFHIPPLSPEEAAFAQKIAYAPILRTHKPPITLMERMSSMLADSPHRRVLTMMACTHLPYGPDNIGLNKGIICTSAGFIAQKLVQDLQQQGVRAAAQTHPELAKRWIEHVDPHLLVRTFADLYATGRDGPRDSFDACYPITDPDFIEAMHLATVYSAIRQKWERLLLQSVYPTSFVPHTSLELVGYMKQVAFRMREVLGRVRLRDEEDGVALEKAISWIVSHREVNGSWWEK